MFACTSKKLLKNKTEIIQNASKFNKGGKHMNVTILGKDLSATEAIKDYVNKKMDRIEKYFGEDFDVSITFRAERNEQIAEMTVKSVTGTFRAVTAHNDLYASIDKDLDIIEGQVRKMKTKKDKANKEDSIKNLPVDLPEREIEGEIIKTIYYDLKPMTPEDAILKLQEKPTDRFVTFINSETNKVNVLFKLKDNKNFGLCEPDV